MPGEISLAHNGVLFLDELPEFQRQALEVLRQPIEDNRVTISRASSRVTYPLLDDVCGGDEPLPLRLPGPSQNRLHLLRDGGAAVHLAGVRPAARPHRPACRGGAGGVADLTGENREESSATVRARVEAARRIQQRRFAGEEISCNARIPAGRLQQFCPLEKQALDFLRTSFENLGMTARAYDRVVKVARTIADLAGEEQVAKKHVAEALAYRALDQKILV